MATDSPQGHTLPGVLPPWLAQGKQIETGVSSRRHQGRLAGCCLFPLCTDPRPSLGGLCLTLKPTPSLPGRPGPNAPLSWVRACVQVLDPKSKWRSKILLGLNFYGMDYSAARDSREPVIGAR